MSRLQNKCLLASAGLHLLLLGALFIGSGFARLRSRPLTIGPALRVVSATFPGERAAAAAVVTPRVAEAPPPRAEPAPTIQEPAPAPVAPVVREVSPPPARSTPPPPALVQRADAPQRPTATKPKIEVSSSLVKRQRSSVRESTPAMETPRAPRNDGRRRESQREMTRRLEESFSGAFSSLSQNLSGATGVEIAGPGGALYADYGAQLQALFDQAWISPAGLDQEHGTVALEILVARDGKVLSGQIKDPSGNAGFDRSVLDAYERVRRRGLPPFPEDTTDAQRRFRIEFNLEYLRRLG